MIFAISTPKVPARLPKKKLIRIRISVDDHVTHYGVESKVKRTFITDYAFDESGHVTRVGELYLFEKKKGNFKQLP